MPPLAVAVAPTGSAASTATSTPPVTGAAFKVQAKSAVALVRDRRIEFVRARKDKALVRIDEATGKPLVREGATGTKAKDEILGVHEIERLLGWKHSRKIGPGFANLGNTCYLNSTLQCLAYTPSFVQFLLQKETLALFGATGPTASPHPQHKGLLNKKPQGNGFCGARVMARLLQSVHGVHGAPPPRVLQPKELVMNIRHISKMFRIGRQEDSHEFFRLLLDAMQRSSLRKAHIKQESHPAAATTFIHRTFGGKLKNTLKCAKCKFVSERWDDFLDLSLEINNGIHSVKGALKHFTATETLDDSNAWRCSSCKQPNRAEKGMTIDKCPNVLVIQLKRFDGMFGKIKKHIEFGTSLDLGIGMNKQSEDRQRGRCRYELHGVLVHAGFSTNCGHYYAFVKGSSGQWYEMNDECVRWVNVDTVLQQKAYMLFYSRVLPPSEQPPPKEKPAAKPAAAPVVDTTKSATASAAMVKKATPTAEAAPAKPVLSMNGFLTSLRTDLSSLKDDEDPPSKTDNAAATPDLGERVTAPTRRVVTYKVTSLPAKNRALKRRLVPAFSGAVGKLLRFRSVAWKTSAPLRMETRVEEAAAVPSTTTTPAVSTPSSGVPKTPTAVATSAPQSAQTQPPMGPEKVAFNPRDLRNFGEKNSALYGKSVETWDGETSNESTGDGSEGLERALAAKHERVLKKMKDEDWKHRRAQRKSSWDEALDLGRTKKLKKRKEFVANEGAANAFHLAAVAKKKHKKY